MAITYAQHIDKVNAFEKGMRDAVNNDIKTAHYIAENPYLYSDKMVRKAKQRIAESKVMVY